MLEVPLTHYYYCYVLQRMWWTDSLGAIHTCHLLDCCQRQTVQLTCYQATHTTHSLKISSGIWLSFHEISMRPHTWTSHIIYAVPGIGHFNHEYNTTQSFWMCCYPVAEIHTLLGLLLHDVNPLTIIRTQYSPLHLHMQHTNERGNSNK
jgi:hypothetical protein